MRRRHIPEARVRSLRSDASRWVASNWKLFLIVLVIATGGFGVYSGVRWACGAEYRQGKVAKLTWRHRTNLRERHEYKAGDWGEPPSRAGYYREPTWGRSCYDKANGSYCCVFGAKGMCAAWCAQYDKWCDYQYYEWPITHFKEIEGQGKRTSWETFDEHLDDTHRETKEGWYTVFFTNTEKTWKYETRDYARYCDFVEGDVWELEFPNIGNMRPTKKTALEAE